MVHTRPRPPIGHCPTVMALLTLTILGAGSACPAAAQSTTPPAAAPAPAGPPSTVDVLVSGQGEPIPGVRVTLGLDNGQPPEQWNTSGAKPVAVVDTDAAGHALFKDVAPGTYIAATRCDVPGNWIAGNNVSRFEAFAGRDIRITLTMRRGGMIHGTAMVGAQPATGCYVRAASLDAILSTCGSMTPSVVDALTGEFTITKVPVNATIQLKGSIDFGPGEISVARSFAMAKPDTLDVTLPFPRFEPGDVGRLAIRFRSDTTAPVDSGNTQITLVRPDGAWSFDASTFIAGRDSVSTLKGLPPGVYTIRSHAQPGVRKPWTAPADSVRILPGATTRYTVHATVVSG